MENEQTQTNTTQPFNSQPDANSAQIQPSTTPDPIALAQSIQQQESGGNYQQVGDNGTSMGAYQWQPETWMAEASQWLGADAPQSPLDATPNQQNEVATKTINSWLQQGLTPPQIASKWNSGDPNAYTGQFSNGTPSIGTNSQLGVKYNVPQYVKDVAQNYQTIKQGGTFQTGAGGSNPSPSQADPTSGMSTLEKYALMGIPIATLIAGFATGGLADTAIPEELAAEGTAEGTGSIAEAATTPNSGLLSKLGTYGKSLLPAGLVEGANVVNGLIGGNKTANAEEDTANATAQAGQEEAQATQQASEAQIQAEESLADQQEQEQKTQEELKNIEGTKTALNESLQSTPTGKILAEQPQTAESIEYMAANNLTPDTSTGLNDMNEAVKKNAQNRSDLSNGIAQVLDTEGKQGLLSDAVKEAYADIDANAPVNERAARKALVDQEAKLYGDAYGGDNISLGDMERSKREQGKAAGDWKKDNKTKGAHKSLYHGMRKTILKNTENKKLYEKVMAEERKSFAADKVMKKMHGKKALEHKGLMRQILKGTGKYIGLGLGDRIGGPLGAVVGSMVGEHLEKAVDKRYGKTYFESKAGKKLVEAGKKGMPKATQQMIDKRLKMYGIMNEEKKKQPIPMGGETREGYKVDQTGKKTVIPHKAEVVQAEKTLPTRNPSSGKMQTTYSSGLLPKKKIPKIK